MTEATLTKKERLLKKQEQIRNELKRLDAQDRQKKRKIENRLKIIIGGTVLAHMEHDPKFRTEISNLLNKYGRKQDKVFIAKNKILLKFNDAAGKKSVPSVSKKKKNEFTR